MISTLGLFISILVPTPNQTMNMINIPGSPCSWDPVKLLWVGNDKEFERFGQTATKVADHQAYAYSYKLTDPTVIKSTLLVALPSLDTPFDSPLAVKLYSSDIERKTEANSRTVLNIGPADSPLKAGLLVLRLETDGKPLFFGANNIWLATGGLGIDLGNAGTRDNQNSNQLVSGPNGGGSNDASANEGGIHCALQRDRVGFSFGNFFWIGLGLCLSIAQLRRRSTKPI